MSYTDGSQIIKVYRKAADYTKQSAIVSCLLKVGRFAKQSAIYSAFANMSEKKPGMVQSALDKSILSVNRRCESFREKNNRLLSSSMFVRWLECSKFLCLPILYFFIDYIFRSYVQIDILSSLWDEAILLAGFGFGIFRTCFQSKGVYGKSTPLSIPITLFILFYISLMLMNSPSTSIGIEGVRAVTQYMLWYFVAILLIDSYSDLEMVYTLFILTGTALALHGIYQFVANVPMPSNWMDMAERGVRTRSFSIIGSPNILGSVMTILIPMSMALFFAEKKLIKKAFYMTCTGLMALCLVFTQSRGAWIGFGVAVLVFFLIYDKRFILPVIFAGLLVFVTVPQVYSRITYMLSEQYILSSLTGGRLVRWITGLELLEENMLLGLGIGRFGGAVAMNHKSVFPDTFYMDNYYLKTAVEGGIFAVISFIFLMISVFAKGLNALKRQQSKKYKFMITGMLSGLTGIMAHNFFENVFEVPAMVTYFWIITAMIMFLGFGKNGNRRLDV